MEDPVVIADRHTYERKAITAWLAKNNTSPMTGATLETTSLYPTCRCVVGSSTSQRHTRSTRTACEARALDATALGARGCELGLTGCPTPPYSRQTDRLSCLAFIIRQLIARMGDTRVTTRACTERVRGWQQRHHIGTQGEGCGVILSVGRGARGMVLVSHAKTTRIQ